MKISDHVIQLDCTKGAYAYAILKNGVTLIDTGMPKRGQKIMDELKGYGVQPGEIKQILLTHHDIDHIGSAAFLQKLVSCDVMISKEDYPYMVGKKTRPGIKGILGKVMKAELPSKIICFDDEMLHDIKIISTPGHTPGHRCFQFENVMFTGDLMRSSKGEFKFSPGIMNWNKELLTQSIKNLSVDGVEWLCPAHGEPVRVKDAWNTFLKEI